MAHVDNLRRHFPAVRHVTYFNTGTCGALSDAAVEAMQTSLSRQLAEGRSAQGYYAQLMETQQKVREQLANLFHTEAECFALTDSATAGINTVLWGLSLASRDEIIVTDTEHPGVLLPVFIQKQRRQVGVKVMDGNLPPDLFIAALEANITPRTRVIVVSHVSFETGYRLPLERIAQVAKAHGVYLAVDGSQGAGSQGLDLAASGIDFYAFPGHKWLCGPDGTGALYVRKALWSVLDPSFVGEAGMGHAGGYERFGTFLAAPSAQRYEHSLAGLANWSGFLAGLEFLRVSVGWDYAFSRIHGLTGRLMDQLLDYQRVKVVTPRELRAGILSFQVEGLSAQTVVKEAKARSIDIEAVTDKNLVRISTGLYNTEEDLERLTHLLNQVLAMR